MTEKFKARWPTWFKVSLTVFGTLTFIGLVQNASRTKPTMTIDKTYGSPSPKDAALTINLHGELCATVTDMQWMRGSLYRISCSRYRDGTGSASYILDVETGRVK